MIFALVYDAFMLHQNNTEQFTTGERVRERETAHHYIHGGEGKVWSYPLCNIMYEIEEGDLVDGTEEGRHTDTWIGDLLAPVIVL